MILKIIFILLLILVILIFYAIIENKILLRVRREIFYDEPDGVKIIHLSDLHHRSFGVDNIKLINKVKAENPDIIICSGDMLSRDTICLKSIEHLIKQLTKIAPVYYSYGNHETTLKSKIFDELYLILLKNNVHILDNTFEDFEYNNRPFRISGAVAKSTIFKKNGTYKDLDDYKLNSLKTNLGDATKERIQLLIAHSPLFAKVYAEWGADYTFCGHVHGGIVRIPFTNIGLLSPERKFFPKYSKGVFNISQSKILVSAGLGKFRLFNPAEIVVYII